MVENDTFVFADPGVIVEEKGMSSFRGRSYQVYHVGFKTGTGRTSEDEYVLYVDPQNYDAGNSFVIENLKFSPNAPYIAL